MHVPFCASRCAYCDFNTYTAAELRGRDARAGFAADAIAEVELAARALPATRPLVPDGLLRRRHADAAARRRPRAHPAGRGRAPGSRARRRGDGRGQPRVGRPGRARAPARARRHPRVAGDAERRPARARRARACAHAGPRAGGGRRGARGGLRARQPRPHLRDAGGDGRRLGGLAGRRAGGRPRPRERLRPDAGARAPGWTRACAAATCRPRTTTRWPTATWPPTRRWPPPGWAGTRSPTGRPATDARCRHNVGYWRGADWWGVGPGAHSHLDGRRWWNVRHPSDYAARLAAGRSPAAGAGGPRRGGAPARAHHARDPHRRRPRRRACWRRAGAGAPAGWRPRACSRTATAASA